MPQISKFTHKLVTGHIVEVLGVISLDGSNFYRFSLGKREAYLPTLQLLAPANETKILLARQDIAILNTSDWAAIRSKLETINKFVRAPLLVKPGWTKPYFAQSSGKVFAPKGIEKPAIAFQASGEQAAKGTYARWRRDVAEPLAGQHIPMLALLAGLASPLLRFTREDLNFGIEFNGKPGTGKTTCLRVFNSVAWGPDEIPTFNGTMAGFEAMFPTYADGPFPIDETNLFKRGTSSIRDFAFTLANGTIRVSKFQSDRQRYHFIFATTANTAFHRTLGDIDADIAGAALQRLIPIKIPDRELGVFDFLPDGFASSGALAEHLNDAVRRQYGTPMRRLLQHLVNIPERDVPKFSAMIDEKIKALEDAVGISSTARGHSRVSSAFGLLNAAGSYAQQIGILPPEWDSLAACVAGFRNYQEQLPGQTPLLARLLTIAQRPETLDQRETGIIRLSDAKKAFHGAFVRRGKGGRIELLLTDAVRDQFFPDWARVSQSEEFRRAHIRDKDHVTVHRQIRTSHRRERFTCFTLPADLAAF